MDEKAGSVSMEEGCLSIPGLSEHVSRPKRIHATWLDENLQQHDEWVDDYQARVMQHEFDHLEGVLYIDKVSPFRKQMNRNKLKAMSQGKFSASYRTKPIRK